MQSQILEWHLKLLERAGGHLAREGALPLPLRLAINRPPLILDEYWKICRGYEDASRKRLDG